MKKCSKTFLLKRLLMPQVIKHENPDKMITWRRVEHQLNPVRKFTSKHP